MLDRFLRPADVVVYDRMYGRSDDDLVEEEEAAFWHEAGLTQPTVEASADPEGDVQFFRR